MLKSQEIRRYSRRMRRNPTRHERICSEKLKNLKIEFKQQLILGFYIIDFIIPSKMLIIEIDGKSHDDSREYDNNRDKFCEECGLTVLRIKNEDILQYDLSFILKLKDYPDKKFRSALGKANSIKGVKLAKKYRIEKPIIKVAKSHIMNKVSGLLERQKNLERKLLENTKLKKKKLKRLRLEIQLAKSTRKFYESL